MVGRGDRRARRSRGPCRARDRASSWSTPRPVGSGATAAGMGHIPVMDDSEAQFALCRYSQSLWDGLADQLPAAVEFDRCGTLWVATDDEEMAEVHRKKQFYDGRGLERTSSTPGHARRRPSRTSAWAGRRLVLPCDGVIYPPCAPRGSSWMRRSAGAPRRGSASPSSRSKGDFGHASERDDGSRPTPWSTPRAGRPADVDAGLEIRPRKGHLVITDRYPGYLRHQFLEFGYLKSAHGSDEDSVAFNVQPRRTGQILIGSSRQPDVSDPKVDRPILERMIRRAIEYMPGSLARLLGDPP